MTGGFVIGSAVSITAGAIALSLALGNPKAHLDWRYEGLNGVVDGNVVSVGRGYGLFPFSRGPVYLMVRNGETKEATVYFANPETRQLIEVNRTHGIEWNDSIDDVVRKVMNGYGESFNTTTPLSRRVLKENQELFERFLTEVRENRLKNIFERQRHKYNVHSI